MRLLLNFIERKYDRKKVLLLNLLFFLLLVILGSCNLSELSSQKAPQSKISINMKQGVSRTFFNISGLKPLSISKSEFFTNSGWYDESNFLFITRKNGLSSLKKYNIYTGEHETIFINEQPITSVYPNNDQTLFAIQVVNLQNESLIYIINKLGDVEYTWQGSNSELQITWNPNNSNQIYIAAFLSNWDFELYYVDVTEKSAESIDVENPFIQWIDSSKIGYLKWNQNHPSHFAPLYMYDLETETEKIWQDKVSGFMTFTNLIITVTSGSNSFNKSTFGFYNSTTKQKITELEIPIISTFSEHIWIPNHDFFIDKQLFYFFKPLGDIVDEHQGFQLKRFSLVKGTEELVYEFDSELPFKLSPNGKWVLIGRQLEQIIDLESKSIHQIVFQN